MAITFKTPEDVADEYLTELKVLKPSVNTSQTDSDWWVRSRVAGSIVSGVYADQVLIANDAFPQNARHEALGRFLDLYFSETFKSAGPAVGFALVTGATGSTVTSGLQFSYLPNGNIYQATSGQVMGATEVLVPVQSVATGQSQNLVSGAPLTVVSPPAGVNATASASGDFTDGRDSETDAQAASRILNRIRSPIRGGTASDYQQWAIAADNSVVSANVIRFPFGFGSVGVVITAGTTDIDAALDSGQAVVLEPSDALIQKVQAYIDALRPLTDCASVLAPVQQSIDVTVNVAFVSGDGSTILGGQTLTQAQLVQREVQRAIYKTPPGGRQVAGSGFVLAAEIEETIDVALSANPFAEGSLPIIVDRQVQNLSVSGVNYPLTAIQFAVPGTITVVEVP